MQTELPLTRDIVLIGGGHTHALVLRRWGMRPLPGARLTVINPGTSGPYTGMLPGFVAGHYTREELDIDLVRLCRFAGARLILGAATGLDRAARLVHVEGRPPVAYDIVSLNIGITSAMPDLPGFAEHAIPAKPLDRFATRWTAFLGAARDGGPAEAALVGAGVAGVELALAMAYALGRAAPGRARVSLLDRGDALATLSQASRRALLERLDRAGVNLYQHADVTAVGPAGLSLGGRDVPSAFTVGTAGAKPYPWLAETGLPMTDGFVAVDDTLRSPADPCVYAAGDCAHLTHAPRPKAGVYAVREAPVLFHNLRADLTGRQRRRYRPQADFLKIISLGRKSALAAKWGLTVEGPWIWSWKDRIDRRFMDRFRQLPAMPGPTLPRERAEGSAEALGPKPLCGGCGSKVGANALSRALDALPAGGRDDVLSRPGDDAAILAFGATRQVLTTDHLRAFALDPCLMARIAAVHALGDVWAMGASPQAALASIILPRLSEPMQERWLGEIMAAAADVFRSEGAEIVGGHTSVGAELTIGFTVTGIAASRPVTLAGAKAGDLLILTKPLGTGILLAAEMQAQAAGEDVAGAWACMARPQGGAARALSRAHAMTDVTGFGLAGHLLNICAASGVAARLSLDAIPILPGALSLSERGVASSLAPANRAALSGRIAATGDPRAALLVDPQTAGGLLAAVAPGDATPALRAIRAQGLEAALIGEIVSGTPAIDLSG